MKELFDIKNGLLGSATFRPQGSCFAHGEVNCKKCPKYIEKRKKSEIFLEQINEFEKAFLNLKDQFDDFQITKEYYLNKRKKETFEQLYEEYEYLCSEAGALGRRYTYHISDGVKDE